MMPGSSPRSHRTEELVPPAMPVEQLKFQSLSEFACVSLLEKYTPWKAVQRFTFQVDIGRTSFDFLIFNTLVEYHPISLRREMQSNALSKIMSAVHRLNRGLKVQVLDGLREELESQYVRRRRQVASAHPVYKELEVVCAFSPESFISLVIKRFANRPLPKDETLVAEFRQFQKRGRSHLQK